MEVRAMREQVCCVRIITHEGREVRPDPRNAGREIVLLWNGEGRREHR